MPMPNDEKLVATSHELVSTLKKAFGSHPGQRPNHTKGIGLKGIFTPSSAAKELSTAPHFNNDSTPILVRFSNSTGIPTIPDNDASADPRGLAVRFDLGPHKHTDIVAHSIAYFPVRTGEEFLDFLNAVIASSTGTSSPSPIEEFLAAHPKAAEFVSAHKPAPASFAENIYWGINAFVLVGPSGNKTNIRYRFLPEHRSPPGFDSKDLSADYLHEEIKTRVEKTKIVLKLVAQIAEEGDITDNATEYWPETRKIVELGTLSIDKLMDEEEQKNLKKDLIFDPIPRVQGIEASTDPLLEMRAGVYLVSGKERRAA